MNNGRSIPSKVPLMGKDGRCTHSSSSAPDTSFFVPINRSFVLHNVNPKHNLRGHKMALVKKQMIAP
ncbi:hypothetical protein [Aeromonas enteropelogenes]|uniref:hypothetical protein n=1 Tax=Aeromonas enteropelogenes TaxID=29489 RepID=UPI0038D07149